MSTAAEFTMLRQIGYSGSLADMRNAYFNDLINGKSSPFGAFLPPDAGEFTTDPEKWNGGGANTTPVSGNVHLVYFTAQRSEAISTLTMYTAGTAAAATPTLCRMGIYDVAANGDLSLNSSTPNDTTLFAAASTSYPKGVSATFNKVAGRRYAAASIVVSAVAMPSYQGHFVIAALSTVVGANSGVYSRRNGVVTGQADLPASVAAGSVGNTFMFPGMRMS